MFTKTITVILPAAESGWEVWRCGNGSGSVWQGSAADPAKGAEGSGSVVVALPARSCRTFAFSAPTGDRQLVRKLAFAQLEKRGLTNATAEQTPFDCQIVRQHAGQSLVSVDVVTPDAANSAGSNTRALVASARLFAMPENKLVVVEEQGRLVLCAGAEGRTLHTQIISNTGTLDSRAADEIRIAGLSLRQQGVISEIDGIELWGDFPPADAQGFSAQLGMPVEIKARPAPDSPLLRREASTRLLPVGSRIELRRRRLSGLKWLAVAALILPVLWWAYGKHRELRALEAEAARIESTLDVPGGKAASADQDQVRAEHELVNAAQARWGSLRLALEPRRYPIAHLDGLTRCMTAADVVLTRFESKIADVTVAGTARSAMDAYSYFNAVNQDGPLGVYGWSMLQPSIGADGSASFEIKGKMR